MAKPWTKKAHEKKALKEKKKDRPVVKEKQVSGLPVDEFVGSLKKLLKALGKENENVLVIDLKRNKVVYGTFPDASTDTVLSAFLGAYLISFAMISASNYFYLDFLLFKLIPLLREYRSVLR